MVSTLEKNTIIRLFNATKIYGKKRALDNVSLDIRRGEFVLLSGASGAGKSTLLKCLYLAESLSHGQILIEGINLARVRGGSLPDLRRRFGLIFQDYQLIPNWTVYENVALALAVTGEKSSVLKKRVMHLLARCGMAEKAKALPPTLSGGEQQRVALARAVVGAPSIILADEPTASLDEDSAMKVMDILTECHRQGTTVVVATHRPSFIQSDFQRRNIVLDQGRLVTNDVIISG